MVYQSAIAPQADQKIVTAGLVFVESTSTTPFYTALEVARFLPDGSLDRLGAGGKADIAGQYFNEVTQEAIAPDGKIVVAGQFSTGTSNGYGGFIARLNSDGTLDSSFGNGGA